MLTHRTGSADDGKRSSLDVTFARGFPKGDNSIYPFGVLQTYGVGGIERATRGPYICTTASSEVHFFGSFLVWVHFGSS